MRIPVYIPMDKKSVEAYTDKLKRNSDAQKLCAGRTRTCRRKIN